MKLGIFGGSFDPPHVGHLIVADDAAAALDLERVLFIPTGEHPLKGARVVAPADLRLEMVRAATEGSELFAVDSREMMRPGPSYTLDTVEELVAENPGSELYLLVGTDILAELQRWHRIEEIGKRARIAVMSRADVTGPVVDFDTIRVEVTHIAVSSSEIRERIHGGRPYRYLVPPGVKRIIEQHGLYRDTSLKSVRR